MVIRGLREDVAELLKDFLYEAIYIPQDITPLERSIRELPERSMYYEGFGDGAADNGLLAEVDGKVVGAD